MFLAPMDVNSLSWPRAFSKICKQQGSMTHTIPRSSVHGVRYNQQTKSAFGFPALWMSSTDLPERTSPTQEDAEGVDELGEQMALEQYNALKESSDGISSALLSVDDFIKWEEIQDVLEYGVVDMETVQIILQEVGVHGGVMTFEQFKESVDLINASQTALEEDEFAGLDFDSEGLGGLGVDEEKSLGIDQETVNQMIAGLGLRRNPQKPIQQ